METLYKHIFAYFTNFWDIDNEVMEKRFEQYKKNYLDISWFDPRNFKDISILPPQALGKVCGMIPKIDKDKLIKEIETFI